MLGFQKRKKVLLLEDDPAMQRLVSTLLKREGYRVDVVGSGREAIRLVGEEDYDALLLDLMMPVEGGMTVIAHLREQKPEVLRRVAVITGSPSSVLDAISREVAIVPKPFDAATLIAAVRRLSS